MKHLRLFAAALVLILAHLATPALAVQGSGCMPTTGTVSGLQFAEAVNAAVAALISTNSGGTAPLTDCSGATITGQQWFDTSLTTPAWRVWDGTQGIAAGYFDTTNHIWMPVTGGGLASVASAATVDLCDYGGSALPQNYVTITGTTAITSLGTSCQPGQIKYLAFTGVTIITYNAGAIVTQTGLNITTAPGDTAQAIYLGGGVWTIVNYQTAGGAVPTGAIIATAGATADAGYLLAYGQCVSATTYAALYNRIGTAWGSCAAGQFALPDLRGRVPAGADAMGGTAANRITAAGGLFDGTVLGNAGGVQSSVVAQANLASFSLNSSVTDPGHVHLVTNYNGGGAGATPGSEELLTYGASANTQLAHTGISVSVTSGGSSTPLPTLSPTQIVNYEIKY